MNAAPPVPVGSTERVDIGGRALNVWRAGEGAATVLLVHGIPTNHRLWQDVVPALGVRARVLAVDMLGYGWSDRPDGWRVDIAAQAGYLLRLLDVLGVDRVVYAGHDLGGGVGQILAVTEGARIEAMTVVDGVAFGGWPVPVARALQLTWPLLPRLPSQAVAAMLRRGLPLLFADQERASAYAPAFAGPWGGPQSGAVLAQHLRGLDPHYTETVAPFLSRLRQPVEVVWGRGDTQMAPRYARMLADTIPTARLAWADGAGHFVPAEAPWAVIEAIARALERASAGPAT